MALNQEELHRLVSLTFDENPNVRKQAAKGLAELDDPAAIFALMELNYDKDTAVKKYAEELLRLKQHDEREVMSFAEIFGPKDDKKNHDHPGENAEDKKKRILYPIEQLFEKKLGKMRADAVKSKMMPTIEKVYFKAVDPKAKEDLETGRKAMQEFLTSYLEAISDLDKIDTGKEEPDSGESKKIEVLVPENNQLQIELETVGSKQKEIEVSDISEEIHEIENTERKEEKEEKAIQSLPQTFFKKAYETMMLSGGEEGLMKKELKRMVRDMERDAKLAFTLAKKKFKETKITNLVRLKEGMRNINSDLLFVKLVEVTNYQKGKQKGTFVRVLVNDQDGNEGVVYLFEGRGEWLREGMTIKVIRGQVKSFEEYGETAITVGKKGNVYVVL